MNETRLKEPGISVVICTFNGRERIEFALKSIIEQKNTSNIPWELVIIDNASTDGTANFCAEFLNRELFSQPFRLIKEPLLGCNNARNRGIRECCYQWMLCCDDDNKLSENYLALAWPILNSQKKLGALGGQGIPVFEGEKPDWFDSYSLSFATGPQARKDGLIPFGANNILHTAGSFFNSDFLQKIFNSGFNTIMAGRKGREITGGEDVEWCILLRLYQYELFYSGELQFGHFMPSSRMTWSYLKKLKGGTTSGAPLFLSYQLFFEKPGPTVISFAIRYAKQLLLNLLIRFKWEMKNILSSPSVVNQTNELFLVVTRSKSRSYIKNFLESLRHFKRIRILLAKNLN
jgi:glycosyltransferase involved in cell wall biosynthesis